MIHNPIAKELRTPKYRPRVLRKRKGKGSYNRKKGMYNALAFS